VPDDAPSHPHAILAYPGVSGAEALGALSALRAAGLDAELVSAEALVLTAEGARLVPHRLGYATLEAAPAVVLPGGDVARPLADAALARALRARRGRWLLAGGEGLRLASAAGLLEGRRVARLPGDLPLPGVEETPSRLVADARLLTALPGDALVDLVLHYVAREMGNDAAARAAHRLGREHRPFVLGGSQA
jgi:transcriptional regulator GlxA family with amidase domain